MVWVRIVKKNMIKTTTPKKSDSEQWASYNTTTDCTLDDFILFIRKKKRRFEWFLSMPILRYNRKKKSPSNAKKNFVSI